MTAINHDIRSRITNAVLKHGFKEKLTAFLLDEAPLAKRLYEHLYPADTRAALDLLHDRHRGSTAWRGDLPVNVGGAKIAVGRDERGVSNEPMAYLLPDEIERVGFRVPMSSQHSNKLDDFGADDALGKEIMAYGLRRDALNKEIKSKRAEITGVLSEIRSDRQLRERWPEVMSIAEPFLRKDAQPQLPAVPVAKLNASLGLPPMKEAA